MGRTDIESPDRFLKDQYRLAEIGGQAPLRHAGSASQGLHDGLRLLIQRDEVVEEAIVLVGRAGRLQLFTDQPHRRP
jgi:hypothetical protein